MAIEFRCPNGHRLSSPVERAGSAGKCPKCGVAFVVPSAEVAAASLSSGPGSAIPAPAAPGSGKLGVEAAVSDAAGPVNNNMIVFLCPNGHKLNSPLNMQGKAGKCPHCGARFLIPHADESFSDDDSYAEGSHVEDAAEPGEGVEQEGIDPEHDEAPAVQEPPPGPPDLPHDFMERLRQGDASPGPQVAPPAAPETASLAHAFRDLWGRRGRGIVRIHLRSGAVLSPERYSAQASDDQCAIFAIKEADGAYSVSAVVWSQVERVVVEGWKSLPEELF